MKDHAAVVAAIKAFDWWNYGLDEVGQAQSDDWAHDLARAILGPPERLDDRLEGEAWRLLLAGAESHTEDAVNEDPDDGLTNDEFKTVRDRAMELIQGLSDQHGVDR